MTNWKTMAVWLCAFVPAWAMAVVEPTYIGQDEVATVQYGSRTVSLTERDRVTPRPLYGMDNALAGYYASIPASLNALISQKLAAKGASFNGGTFGGNISLAFQGGTTANPNEVTVTLSGPSYAASGTVEFPSVPVWLDPFHFVSGSCTASLRFNNMVLSAVYDVTTGQSVRLSAADLHLTHGVSCNTGLDWVPVFGDLINSLVTNFADGLVTEALTGFVSSFTGAGSGAQLPYFGFLNTLGHGQYVVDGFDVGDYLKNNFTNLFIGQAVTMTVYDPAVSTQQVKPAPMNDIDRYYPRFSVSFAGGPAPISFQLMSIKHYDLLQVCPKPGPRCQNI